MSRPPARCGTDSGYYRHRRHGEPACTACLAAHATTGRVRYHQPGMRYGRRRTPRPTPPPPTAPKKRTEYDRTPLPRWAEDAIARAAAAAAPGDVRVRAMTRWEAA
jgi:hypothetical protein